MTVHEAAFDFRLLTSRTGLTGPDGVEGIDTRALDPGAMVLGAGTIYRFDPTSAAVPDGITVLQPNGPGRWIYVAGGAGSIDTVADIATLSLLAAGSPNLVWVNTVTCFWRRIPTSTLVPDGITVVAAIGGGRWERLVPTTARDWLVQATWYVDPTLGDDENPGTQLLPIQTFDEFERRVSIGKIGVDMTVNVVEGASITRVDLEVDTGGTQVLNIQGAGTTVITDDIGTFTPLSHVTPSATQITGTAILDFTPYIGARCRVTSGAATGAIFWVASVNPGGAGVGTARISIPASSAAVAVVLAPGDTFVVETLPIITDLYVRVHSGPGVSPLRISSLRCSGVSVEGPFGAAGAVLDGVQFGTVGGGAVRLLNSSTTSEGGPIFVQRSGVLGGLTMFGSCLMNFGVTLGACSPRSSVLYQFTSMLFQGGTTPLSLGNNVSGTASLSDVQIFDASAAAMQIAGPYAALCRSGLSGSGNAIGLLVGGTGASSRVGRISFGWCTAGDLPNLVGTTAQVRVEGTPDIDLVWAGLSFSSDEQKGIGTLTNGTVTITARNADTRGVLVTKATPSGAPQGVVTAPTASRTATQFVVNAADLATGALVASDQSTFDWWIPPFAREVTLAQLDGIAAAA
jgi:hypothetical protein